LRYPYIIASTNDSGTILHAKSSQTFLLSFSKAEAIVGPKAWLPGYLSE